MNVKRVVKYLPRPPLSLINLSKRRLLRPLRITRFNFEVTRQCNGRCAYCDIWKKPNAVEEITADELTKGLTPRSLLAGVKLIGITGGEPFLRKDLIDICAALKVICPKTRLGLVTNGLQPKLVLKRMTEIRQFDPGVAIGVSLDGFPHIDNFQRGDPQHARLAWQTAMTLKAHGFRVSIGSVVTSMNIDTMAEFKAGCERLGINHSVMTANVSEHYYANKDNPNISFLALPKEKYPLFKKICRMGYASSYRYYFPQYLEEQRQIIPCFSGFNSFFLNAAGYVFPCIHLNAPLGTIRETPFGALWNSDNARKVRQWVVEKKCHCWTECEVGGWIEANVFPALSKALKTKLLGETNN